MRHLMLLIAAAALILSTTTAYADLGDQLAKILPNDGAESDHFGFSVVISGTQAIVGAWRHEDNGIDSGSAYIFDISDRNNPVQSLKLLPDDGEEGDFFGCSVAISGSTAIVGAYNSDDNGSNSGSAYLFNTATGQQIAKLLPDVGAVGDIFGYSVGISGTTAIVGAFNNDDNGSNAGSAYLFNISDPNNPVQTAKLLADDGEEDDYFGQAVAISGARAIVGAWRDDNDDNGTDSGAAYLFDISNPNNPVQITKLLPDDGSIGNRFGVAVAISGTTAIIGAYADNDNGSASGSAYLFDTIDGSQIAKILPDDGAVNDQFGISVGISGTTAIAGAIWHDDNGHNSGSAYLFDISDVKNPVQIAKLLADDGDVSDYFGRAVGISGTTAIVTAYWDDDDDNGIDSGSAYLFDASACPADFDGDGNVGASDLAILLGSWGPCAGCPADFDGDGDVDAFDLATLLGNWGPCP